MGGTVCDLGVAARAIQNDSILLVKEGKGAYVNQWGLPKGRVDPGENLESAVLRELHEETGAGGSIIGLAAVRSTMHKDKPAVFLCFDVHLDTPAEELVTDEISDSGWFKLEELKALEPEVILLSSEPFPFNKKHVEELKIHLPEVEIKIVDGEMFSWYGSKLAKAFPYFASLY